MFIHACTTSTVQYMNITPFNENNELIVVNIARPAQLTIENQILYLFFKT